jgi:hypothetical protein
MHNGAVHYLVDESAVTKTELLEFFEKSVRRPIDCFLSHVMFGDESCTYLIRTRTSLQQVPYNCCGSRHDYVGLEVTSKASRIYRFA